MKPFVQRRMAKLTVRRVSLGISGDISPSLLPSFDKLYADTKRWISHPRCSLQLTVMWSRWSVLACFGRVLGSLSDGHQWMFIIGIVTMSRDDDSDCIASKYSKLKIATSLSRLRKQSQTSRTKYRSLSEILIGGVSSWAFIINAQNKCWHAHRQRLSFEALSVSRALLRRY